MMRNLNHKGYIYAIALFVLTCIGLDCWALVMEYSV